MVRDLSFLDIKHRWAVGWRGLVWGLSDVQSILISAPAAFHIDMIRNLTIKERGLRGLSSGQEC